MGLLDECSSDFSLVLKNKFAYITDFNSGDVFIYSLSSSTSWVVSNTETLPSILVSNTETLPSILDNSSHFISGLDCMGWQ